MLVWRNRRRAPRLPFVAAEESEVQVEGRRTLPDAHPPQRRARLSSTPRPASRPGASSPGIGVSIAVALIVPLLLGVGVDALLHTSPIGVLIGLLVGITAACYIAFAQFKRYI